MGDRWAVGFRQEQSDTNIWLYSHWGGSRRHETLAAAIDAARPRWVDNTYATRIAVSHIIGADWTRETGYGLEAGDNFHTDVEYSLLLVDWERRTVSVVDRIGIVASFGLDEYIDNVRSFAVCGSSDELPAGAMGELS
jgi:hypothetical protein